MYLMSSLDTCSKRIVCRFGRRSGDAARVARRCVGSSSGDVLLLLMVTDSS
jgi:hypothetical protein